MQNSGLTVSITAWGVTPRPEHRNFAVTNGHRIAIVGRPEVANADCFRLADVDRCAMHAWIARRYLDRARRIGGIERAHRNHHGSMEGPGRGGHNRGAIHRYCAAAGDVSKLYTVFEERLLE